MVDDTLTASSSGTKTNFAEVTELEGNIFIYRK